MMPAMHLVAQRDLRLQALIQDNQPCLVGSSVHVSLMICARRDVQAPATLDPGADRFVGCAVHARVLAAIWF